MGFRICGPRSPDVVLTFHPRPEFWISKFGFGISGCWFRVSGFGLLDSDFWFLLSGFRFPVSGGRTSLGGIHLLTTCEAVLLEYVTNSTSLTLLTITLLTKTLLTSAQNIAPRLATRHRAQKSPTPEIRNPKIGRGYLAALGGVDALRLVLGELPCSPGQSDRYQYNVFGMRRI